MAADNLDRILADPLASDVPIYNGPGPKKRSVCVNKQKTSIFLNDYYWKGLKEYAETRGVSVDQVVTQMAKSNAYNLSQALRVMIDQNSRKR